MIIWLLYQLLVTVRNINLDNALTTQTWTFETPPGSNQCYFTVNFRGGGPMPQCEYGGDEVYFSILFTTTTETSALADPVIGD